MTTSSPQQQLIQQQIDQQIQQQSLNSSQQLLPHLIKPNPPILDRLSAFKTIVVSNSAESFYDDLDFAVQRVNFQGQENERHIFQSFRALRPFLIFGGFSAASTLSLTLTKMLNLKPNWALGIHFRFSLFIGITWTLLHFHFGIPLEVRHLLTTPNSSFTKLAYAVLESRDDKDIWKTAFNLPLEPIMDKNDCREYYAVPNFQHSGNSAIVSTTTTRQNSLNSTQNSSSSSLSKNHSRQHNQPSYFDPDVPLDGVLVDENEIWDDVTNAGKLYHSTMIGSPLTINGSFDKTSAMMMKKQSFKSYCEIHDIPMPHYFEEFKPFHDQQINVERPVNFLHMFGDDDEKKIRGHLPPVFQSPHDLIAVNKARTQLQEEINQHTKQAWKQKELIQQSTEAKESGGI